MDLTRIKKPALLLDEKKARDNIKMMKSKAASQNIIFRPHFKTHLSAEIGEWYREAGVDRITVSSATMCRYFMENGWSDITVAFPVNPREADDYNRIARKVNLNILVSDYEQFVTFAEKFNEDANIFIKIDTGYRRSGVDWNSYPDLMRIYDLVNETPNLRIMGLLTHSGHTYSVSGEEKVLEIYNDTRSKILHTKEVAPFNVAIVSIGDTPSCSIATDFKGIDEIRPGNFVFYDLMQVHIGSCNISQVAVALAAPVVSVNRHYNELIIYGGAIHLSKEFITGIEGERIYGKVYLLSDNGWDINSEVGFVRSLSQEHGIVQLTNRDNCHLKPGDLIAVIPVHSCLVADLMRSYITLEHRIINNLSPKL
jgi:D-serine deaminase-like pyridoxal phosphate-dependent protein